MNYRFKNNIRVFYDRRFEQFIGKTSNASAIIKDSGRHIKEDAKGVFGIITSGEGLELAKLMLRTKNKIEEAEKSSNQTVKKVLELLRATGIIEEGIISKARILKRFSEGSGKSGALAIIKALEEAEKGNINIITYANNEYKSQNIKQYEATVKANPEQINTGVSRGLWDLFVKGSDQGFFRDTWMNISVYCAKRNWDTRIIGNESMKSGIMRIYSERKSAEENNLNNILKEQLPDIQKNDPRLAELLKKSSLEMNQNGTIDAKKAIENMKIININQVPEEFRKIAETMKKEAKELFQKAKEMSKSIPIKSLSDIKIPGINERNILDKSFTSFNEIETNKYLLLLQEYRKTIQDKETIKNIDNVIKILLTQQAGFEKTRIAADANQKEKSAKQKIKANPTITFEQLGGQLNSETEQQKARFAQEIAVSRVTTENHLDILREYNINTLEQAQIRLKELENIEKNRTLSKEERILKSELISYIQGKIQEAQVYKDFGISLTKEEKEEIFTSTNRFVSGNEKESYNFQALNKIATLTDPESTPGQKSLAKLEVGQSLGMDRILEGSTDVSIMQAPELQQVQVSKNPDGSYNIPLFNEQRISEQQVKEYAENTSMYAELGLSQFIPHIPLITEELRLKGIDTEMNGSTSTKEQQQVLKALYSELFGKDIITSNINEVKRAFGSSLGNPVNMKNAMQYTLKIHKLIPETGQPIRKETLQKWLRDNKTQNSLSDHITNLT